jgi:CRP/FNR family transcriptional regulator, cyclic AMP receptor protein
MRGSVQELPSLDDFLVSIPLFAGLDPLAVADVALAAERFSFAAGDRLFAQDDPADGVYLVASGAIALNARTPGDGLIELAQVGPGGVIGEFCLLDGGRRSAEARALAPTVGYRIDLERFGGLRASRRPAAFDVLDRLRGEVARRTRAAVEDIARALGAGGAPRAAQALAVPPASESGDCAALLTTFPGFDRFDERLWRTLGGLVTRIEAPRGTRLERPGETAQGLHIVARGAVRAGLAAGEGIEQLLIHGPGALAGAAALVDGGAWPMALDVREDAILLTVAARDCAALRSAHSRLAHRLFDMIGRQLARDLRHISRLRSRIESLDAESSEAA